MKRVVSLSLSLILLLTSCKQATFSSENEITVITREEGSGTRGAFVEIFNIEEKNSSGEIFDMTIDTAETQTSTGVVLTSVEQNVNAVSYISMGSVKNTVKVLKVNGTEATSENIKNGSYEASRPFNIATKENISELAGDYIEFILSTDGQKVIEEFGYISATDSAEAYQPTSLTGTITVSGSSSVTPVMEKLKEAYQSVNTGVTIEINMSDSTTGVSDVAEGNCDIGMTSRNLKDSEMEKGIKSTTIALDGIVIIVNPQNTMDSITKEDVKNIYTGNAVKWSDVIMEN